MTTDSEAPPHLSSPRSCHEEARLAALRSYEVLDTEEEEDYDRLVALAAEICQTPVSLVSFIDEHRQWLKARVGTHLNETDRAVAFCSTAIEGRDTLVVEDATRDPRFADNPLVAQEPNIKFYAGSPIVTNKGHALGTLCVIDMVPRQLQPHQLAALETLSRSVATLLEASKARKLQKELRESERRLSISLSCAKQIWWDWQIDAKVMSIHGTDQCILGYDCLEGPQEETFWWDLMHADDVSQVKASLEAHFADGSKTWQAEHRFRDRSGVYRWVLQSGTVTDWSADGSPTRMIGITQLNDERKRTELELKRTKSLYQSIVHDQTELICRFDQDFTVTFLNAAYQGRLTSSKLPLQTMNWLEAFPDSHRDQIIESINSLQEDETTKTEPLPFRACGGPERWIQWTIRRLDSESEDGERYQAVGVDVTQAISAENQLRELLAEALSARKAAEKANHAKSDFLAAMSHELRTPLNPIIAGAELLQDDLAGTDHAELAEMISTAGHHLLGMIGQVLDLSKLEAGKVEPVFEFDDVASTLRSLCNLHLAQCQQSGLSLKCKIADEIPQLLLVDASILRQVLINFLSNAVKFTSEGGIRMSAAYAPEATGPDGTLSITVKDTGIGIAKEMRERIFRPFEQADSGISRKYGGTGIGLSICKALVELLGGSIAVESEAGQGTEFTVAIPASRPDPDESAKASVAAQDSGEGTSLAGRILVVEDDPSNQLVIKRLLNSRGIASETVGDGLQALEKVETNPPSLILMDLHLPRMNGFEAIEAIRKKWGERSPAIVAMSADARPEISSQLARLGVDTLITKPFQGDSLFSAIAKFAPN